MRGVLEVRDEVLGRAGRYEIVAENLQVKEVLVEDRRYVVCFDPEEAEKARRDREKIVEKLRKKLDEGGPIGPSQGSERPPPDRKLQERRCNVMTHTARKHCTRVRPDSGLLRSPRRARSLCS